MSWIWLDREKYGDCQLNFSNENSLSAEEKAHYRYAVADIKKDYRFEKKIKKVILNVSADNSFHLYVNCGFVGMGPVLPGGDFLCRQPAPKHYYNTYEIDCSSNELSLFAKVKLLPFKVCEYSRNHGGFYLVGTVMFEDGSFEIISTDSSWQSRVDKSYTGYLNFDNSEENDDYINSEEIEDIWLAERAEIPMLSFEKVYSNTFTLKKGEKKTFTAELPKIYGAYPVIKSFGKCKAELKTSELENQETENETALFDKAGEYFSFVMHSVGFFELTAENTDDRDIELSLDFLASYYPVPNEGKFICSDEGFNKVYEICRHTLKICRQTIHLDSTHHQELLACTGDYYIDALMTVYLFGDMRLAEFDIIRTADWIVQNCGRMNHTTYSLIWVQMLRDVFMVTGNTSLLERCRDALEMLHFRMCSYKGRSGMIEFPPDFMFVDWTVIDGYSMHRPPKALGQTVLNAYYYNSLKKAEEIYRYLHDNKKADEYKKEADDFRVKFNREFFDGEKGLYFDGKNDSYGGFERHIPKNSFKRYYTKYPNILAALYGLADTTQATEIIEKLLNDYTMHDIQPYFMHFMILAVRKLGLFPKYGMKLLERWKPVADECDKGLKEGWIAPEEGYSFDHSHSWGGTVAYQLPSVITGMKILEPGMKKLSFEPELYGLDFADITIPTVYGEIEVKLKKGEEPKITVPDGIEAV